MGCGPCAKRREALAAAAANPVSTDYIVTFADGHTERFDSYSEAEYARSTRGGVIASA